MAGPKSVKYYNLDGEIRDKPSCFKELACNVVVVVRGVYLQKNMAGLIIEARNLQFEEKDQKDSCPFKRYDTWITYIMPFQGTQMLWIWPQY